VPQYLQERRPLGGAERRIVPPLRDLVTRTRRFIRRRSIG
jgi:hypothetical protein